MPMCANGYTKLSEELGELAEEFARREIGRLQQIVGKRLAYFHTDEHPDGKGSIRARMQNEMGDTLAAIWFAAEANGLDTDAIDERMGQKLALFRQWHADPDNNKDAVDRVRA